MIADNLSDKDARHLMVFTEKVDIGLWLRDDNRKPHVLLASDFPADKKIAHDYSVLLKVLVMPG